MADQIIKAAKLDANGKPIADGAAPAAPASPKGPVRHLRANDTRSVPLQWPLEYDGQEYHELVFRRLTGRDFAKLQKAQQSGESSEDMMMVSVMTGAPIPVLDALDAEDYLEVIKALQDFLPAAMLAAGRKMAEELAQEASSNASSDSDGGESNSGTGPNTPPSSPRN